jgi:hypothetical protein
VVHRQFAGLPGQVGEGLAEIDRVLTGAAGDFQHPAAVGEDISSTAWMGPWFWAQDSAKGFSRMSDQPLKAASEAR